jgi:hypothetical protein
MSRTFRPSTLHTVLAAAALIMAVAPASAATWSKASTAADNNCDSFSGPSGTVTTSSAGNTCRLDGGTNDATVSAWATSGAAATSSSVAGAWSAAALSNHGSWGLGAAAVGESVSGQPEHAADNLGRKEAFVIKFDKATSLNSLSVGYWAQDLDITVMAYTGPAITSASQGMINWGVTNSNARTGAANNGWQVLGNYANSVISTGTTARSSFSESAGTSSCTGTATRACNQTINLVNSGGLSSSYWLVSAYSSAFGGPQVGTGVLSNGNDYFKLLSFSGTTAVSEPGALALAGLGLFGVAWSRRAKKQAAA